jgi:antitoxin HigA-1
MTHHPLHPGKVITDDYLIPHGISRHALARHLDGGKAKLNRILKGIGKIDAEMALRLSKTLGPSAESWLSMQRDHDLWHAKRLANLTRVSKLEIAVA